MADRYELTYPVGRGGMGEVWAGFDRKLDRPVAIKFLRQADMSASERENAVERFMREARVTARLDHAGVPAVHDVGFHGRDIYLVMQLVPGLVLADLIAERGWLSVPWAAAIGAQICSVLAAAHAASLVHRDLKPQNVMVTPAGTVKVLDFGVAALLGPASGPRLTATNESIGTPTYMAPEQALNRSVGPRADLYALGCLLFETLTGAPPYHSDTPLGMLHRHLNDPVPVVAEHRPGVPEALAHLVALLLAKDPQDRPESAAEVYDLLVPFASVAIGFVDDPAATTAGGQSIDPTMPYRYPFGPLPQATVPAPTKVDVSPRHAAQQPADEVPSFEELAEIQDQARGLAEEERFTQAAEALETVLRRAVKAYGVQRPQILDLRLDLANFYVLAGAYRQALPEFTRLAHDLAQRPSVDQELVWHCRQQAASCQAELGEAAEALAALRALLVEEQQVLPADAPEMFGLRHQIATLTAAVGDVAAARDQLGALLEDVRRSYGPHSPEAADIEALLAHLGRLDDGRSRTSGEGWAADDGDGTLGRYRT
ncbi:protein kinase [Micromonospora sp. CPCC 206060]|uniref:serine/threonine-protein kinase n=1 Tax=Micromonospora sp. CPCC 206060 TaxID=3122406 RepID=UPI002FEE9C9A